MTGVLRLAGLFVLLHSPGIGDPEARLLPTLRRPASLRPCQTIHSPAFGRSDEILYLVEEASDLTLPDFRPLPHPVAKRSGSLLFVISLDWFLRVPHLVRRSW